MEWFPWIVVGLMGFVLFILLWHLMRNKNQNFDAPLLGLLTLAIFLVSIALFQPPTLKYGDLEFTLREVQEATQDAKVAGKLASEAAAIMFWNAGRLDGADIEKSKQIFKSIYGQKKGQELIEYYIDQGVLKTSEDERTTELEGKSKIKPPKELDSPYLELFMRKTE